jgi:hypothetical protein
MQQRSPCTASHAVSPQRTKPLFVATDLPASWSPIVVPPSPGPPLPVAPPDPPLDSVPPVPRLDPPSTAEAPPVVPPAPFPASAAASGTKRRGDEPSRDVEVPIVVSPPLFSENPPLPGDATPPVDLEASSTANEAPLLELESQPETATVAIKRSPRQGTFGGRKRRRESDKKKGAHRSMRVP